MGGWFKSDNKATLTQQSWSWGLAELGNKSKMSTSGLQCPRAVHTLGLPVSITATNTNIKMKKKKSLGVYEI